MRPQTFPKLNQEIRGKLIIFQKNFEPNLHAHALTSFDFSKRTLKTDVMYERKCQTHGKYLNYERYLNTMKNYIMVGITIIMLIIALVLYNVGLSLGWLYSFMGIIVGPAVVPVTLSLFWARLNSFSMFVGLLAGLILGLVSWIVTTIVMFHSFTLASSGLYFKDISRFYFSFENS
jgi:ABC-type xylose transport system permease subunit